MFDLFLSKLASKQPNKQPEKAEFQNPLHTVRFSEEKGKHLYRIFLNTI